MTYPGRDSCYKAQLRGMLGQEQSLADCCNPSCMITNTARLGLLREFPQRLQNGLMGLVRPLPLCIHYFVYTNRDLTEGIRGLH